MLRAREFEKNNGFENLMEMEGNTYRAYQEPFVLKGPPSFRQQKSINLRYYPLKYLFVSLFISLKKIK